MNLLSGSCPYWNFLFFHCPHPPVPCLIVHFAPTLAMLLNIKSNDETLVSHWYWWNFGNFRVLLYLSNWNVNQLFCKMPPNGSFWFWKQCIISFILFQKKRLWRKTVIVFITFWDFLMVEQVFLSLKLKLSVIISNKLVYSPNHDSPNNLRLRKLGLKTSQNCCLVLSPCFKFSHY